MKEEVKHNLGNKEPVSPFSDPGILRLGSKKITECASPMSREFDTNV